MLLLYAIPQGLITHNLFRTKTAQPIAAVPFQAKGSLTFRVKLNCLPVSFQLIEHLKWQVIVSHQCSGQGIGPVGARRHIRNARKAVSFKEHLKFSRPWNSQKPCWPLLDLTISQIQASQERHVTDIRGQANRVGLQRHQLHAGQSAQLDHRLRRQHNVVKRQVKLAQSRHPPNRRG